MSDDKPAADTLEIPASLQDKHPHPGVAYNDRPPVNVIHKALEVDEDDILRAIRSFPAGSSGGSDGLRLQHILELVTCREAAAELVMATTSFTNVLLDRRWHADVVPILFGGSLVALQKKSSGIRSIAIGYTWRRLASKCANTYATAELADLFSSIQIGVGVPGGCEAAVHAARRYAEDMPDDHVIVKLDFSNAFNSLRHHSRDFCVPSKSALIRLPATLSHRQAQ